MDGRGLPAKYQTRRIQTKHTVFDRFIPYRPCLNGDASYAKILAHQDGTDAIRQPAQHQDPRSRYYRKLLDAVFKKSDHRILAITQRPLSGYSSPMSPNRSFFNAPMDDLFATPSIRRRRHVPKSPICVMDLPKLRNNFFTNNLDWGKSNKIAVALNLTTYVWDAQSKLCQKIQLTTSRPEHDYISCLAWDPDGTQLVIADNLGDITVCDPECSVINHQTHLKERTTVNIVRWTDHGIYSGDRHGTVYKHDPRVRTAVARLGGHDVMVCGLSQGPGTHYLASGGGDGLVCIWDVRSSKVYRKIKAHTLLAKALAWCPWRKNVLASGGGCDDGNIRLWNINTGNMVGEILTQSQICGMLWSEEYHELVSSHGQTKAEGNETNDLILWEEKDFYFEPVAKLQQHIGRPLHLAMSPDKTHIASVGADEHICLWHCFPASSKEEHSSINVVSPVALDGHIR
ncbi:uncharacterized protein LOC132556958 [Ylistrum balloti]|uniref:uncharacterized protein LOC132556958 n=1 Tax=Ylistrum balloti TaxID=509963 RepID=UPI002905800D|nr:uncharacterized protein LOC132556958 [Ylistrum balloti]